MNCIWIMVCSVSQVWADFRGIGSDELYLDNGLICVSGWTVSGQWPHQCLRPGPTSGGLGLMDCIWTMVLSVSQVWVYFRGIGSDELYLDNGLICVSGLGLLQGDWVWWNVSGYWPFVRGFHESPVHFSSQRPVTRSFDVYFDLRLNKRLRKQSWGMD